MGTSDSLQQKKIKFFCPILDTSTCVQAHILLQSGQVGHESENAPVLDGAF